MQQQPNPYPQYPQQQWQQHTSWGSSPQWQQNEPLHPQYPQQMPPPQPQWQQPFPPQQPYDQPQAYYEYAAPPQVPYGAFPYQQPYGQPPTPYGYSAPPLVPYSAFPYQQPGYVYGTPPVQAARLPLGEAIRQLPGQYIKVAFTKRSAATFAEEQSKASWGSVWFQLIFYALVFAILVCVDELITNTAASVLDLIFIIFLSIVVIPIAFFVIPGIYYLIARAFGGKGTFLAQIYTMLLFTVPLGILAALLSLIPIIGSFANRAVGGYLIFLNIRMIMGVHRLSAGKATSVILIPLAVIIFIVILLVVVVVAVRPA